MSHGSEMDDTSRVLAQVIQEQQAIFLGRQPRSAELGAEAMKYLAGGATSSWQPYG
jgi:glutamate-1-semialdehyde 2,1-aminomutase